MTARHSGLAHDLALIERRDALRLIAGAALLPLIGCARGQKGSSTCPPIPDETAGPYPADDPETLGAAAIVRSDIRSSFGSMTGVAQGVPLELRLTLIESAGACAPLAGRAIYLWHCDRDAEYSLYTLETENYLRGVQETDASGTVTFQTIFPGCYSGRWPHFHFQVYRSLASARAIEEEVATSQIALPEAPCREVYATDAYRTSLTRLDDLGRLEDDGIFDDDDVRLQIATVTGSPEQGYVATLTFAVI